MENRGRKPVESEARTALVKVRVRPASLAYFTEVAKERNLTVADALREAMKDWTRKATQ